MTTPLQTPAPEMGGRRSLAVALMALIFTLLLPLAGFTLSMLGVFMSVRDMKTLRRGKQRLGLVTAALTISAIALLLGLVSTAVQLYFADELQAYNECQKGAGTVTAKQECAEQLKHGFEKKLGVPWPADMPFPV